MVLADINNTLELAIHWLTKSGIINTNRRIRAYGGINQGYDCKRKQYSFVYSEITGYAISMFLNLYRWMRDEEYLKMACEAADYLLSLQCTDESKTERGGILHSLSLPDMEKKNQYYSFDTAMCLQGLVDLYVVTKQKQYYDASVMIGKWLVNKMQMDDGAFLAMYDAETGEMYHAGGFFDADKGCLHAKHAIGLLKLYEITKEQAYLESAKKVCDWVLSLQADDGAFWANIVRRYVFTHAHCYATEGLLYAYWKLKDERYLDAVQKSADWLMCVQGMRGAINRDFKNHLSVARFLSSKVLPLKAVDATAQATRIWCTLFHLQKEIKYLKASEKAVKFLQSMQCINSSDSNAIGGFYYHHVGGMKIKKILYTWCAMFTVAALWWFQKAPQGSLDTDMIVDLF